MRLAGDLGGTKTLLGIFERGDTRPRPTTVREYPTLGFTDLSSMIHTFLDAVRVDPKRVAAAVIGVAGPVRDQSAELTNVPWRVDAREIAARTGLSRVSLLNDVEAMAHSVDVLAPDEQVVLQPGLRRAEGNGALLSIGTGVGQAILHRVDGHFVPVASEGGHADFAARTDREVAVLLALRARFGRVDVERVVAGPGLANVASVVHSGTCPAFPADLVATDEPAMITRAALDGTCPRCRESLDLYVEALGAAAGNLALQAVATGGLFLGGGVSRKIIDALRWPVFLSAFTSKAPLDNLVQAIPVSVITLPEAGLLGAAVRAARLG